MPVTALRVTLATSVTAKLARPTSALHAAEPTLIVVVAAPDA